MLIRTEVELALNPHNNTNNEVEIEDIIEVLTFCFEDRKIVKHLM